MSGYERQASEAKTSPNQERYLVTLCLGIGRYSNRLVWATDQAAATDYVIDKCRGDVEIFSVTTYENALARQAEG